MSKMTKEEYESQLETVLLHVPEQYRDKVAAKAWESGHAYGYEEVILEAEVLADLFCGSKNG